MTDSTDSSREGMTVFVVSDGTGDTGSAAVRAAMVQFGEPWRLRVFRDTRSLSDVRRVLEKAQEANAIVVFSLVDGGIVDALLRDAEARGVVVVDLLGPLIMKVAQRLHVEPRHQPGLLHGFSDDYFKRVEAVEFAVRHDDGANLHTLHEADIVLTGVSRTSKTPLSMYLAQRGYKTGNVPLIPGLEPPKELLELSAWRVFGLTVDPGTLLSVRTARLRTMKAPSSTSYTDPDHVMLELDRARRLFRSRGWRTIDVSGRAVEENASRIVESFGPPNDGRPSPS
ncbi:MAG TPA: pyruvate, water dikinase regulatory protein [Myxococcota bacterium]|nr:pyruvate, water dikinase regulatory protein [Myxococcota bacterium]